MAQLPIDTVQGGRMAMISRVLFTIVVLALLVLPAAAMAQDHLDAGWADKPPTLDGTLGVAEWEKAAVVALIPTTIITEPAPTEATRDQDGTAPLGQDLSPSQVSGSARFMNDNRYLYVALSLDIGAPPATPNSATEMLSLWFEDEPTVGDGQWAASDCSQNPDEGYFSSLYTVGASPQDSDTLGTMAQTGGCVWSQSPAGYTRAFGWGSSNWELRVDLSDSALQAAPGECVFLGVYVGSAHFSGPQVLASGAAEWPEGIFGIQSPDVLGEVCLAEESEFVPEQGTMALLGTGLAGLSGYATLRWRSRRKE
jgi:hypothetical protein